MGSFLIGLILIIAFFTKPNPKFAKDMALIFLLFVASPILFLAWVFVMLLAKKF